MPQQPRAASVNPTALSSWVLLIAKAVDSYGCDSRTLFRRAGLDYDRLHDPVARFSYRAVSRLWELASEETGDPCFGLTAASFWHPTTLHALGYSWLASHNLREALERTVRYSRIVNTAAANGMLRLEETADAFCVAIDASHISPAPTPMALEAGLAMLMAMCRATLGDDFNPQRVELARNEPACAQRFSEYFRAPVRYACTDNAVWLDADVVTAELTTANPVLVRVNDQIIAEYVAQLDRRDIGMRVKAALIEYLPSGNITEAEIASAINLSRRSLQRKLSEQGVTFTQLLDGTRRELSEQYVRDPSRPINEIAFLLGFSEPSNFTRAFKRWHGRSPSEYRFPAA